MMRLIHGLTMGAAALIAAAPVPAPYRLLSVTPVPAMPEGDWDQLDADVPHNRLYVAAEDGDAIDVFDLRMGTLVRTAPLPSPHKLALDARRQRLFVANGKDGTVEVLTTDLTKVKTIPVGARPDTGVLDPVARLFYVSSRAGDAAVTTSRISAISLDTLAVVRTFDVPATTLKGLILDAAGKRLFVSMRDKNAIGVVDLVNGKVDVWTPQGINKNVPLAYDARSQRLFVGSREPGQLIAIDTHDGKPVQSLPATETADSMSWDAGGRILYLSGDTGMSRYHVAADGTAESLGTDPALVGKTSLYVDALRRLYVLRPRKGTTAAALQIYKVDRAN